MRKRLVSISTLDQANAAGLRSHDYQSNFMICLGLNFLGREASKNGNVSDWDKQSKANRILILAAGQKPSSFLQACGRQTCAGMQACNAQGSISAVERHSVYSYLISGCEVQRAKAPNGINRHAANRGLQHPQGVSLDMCPACDAIAPLSCEWTTIEKRQANQSALLSGLKCSK